MDALKLIDGIVILWAAGCLVVFALMATANAFSKDESCKPEDEDNE